LVRYGAIVASATMFALYARVEQPWAWLGWVALVPWLSVLERERSTVAAMWSGVVMSMAFVLGVFAWFASAVAHYTGISPLLSFALLIVAAPLLQPQFVVFAAVHHLLASRRRGLLATSVGAACAWVGAEWLFPHLFGDTIGQGLFAFDRLRQGADLAGTAGLTFVVVVVNECAYEAIRHGQRAPRRALSATAAALVLVSVLAGYGVLRWRQVVGFEPEHAPVKVALVQANLGDYAGLRARLGTYGAVREILDDHEKLSRAALARTAGAAELLVWPETVYPTTFGQPKSPAGKEFDDEIVHFAASSGVPLLFGTYDRDGEREFNAAVLVQQDASGRAGFDVYRKRRLFPLTEEVPAWLDTGLIRAELPWLGTWRAGEGGDLLAMRRRNGEVLHLAPLICLDAVDPGLAIDAARHGADLIVTLSNDGWFAGSRGARLHLVVSAFRSIETRLPQIRATNTGISAVITPTGEILDSSPVGKATVLAATVKPGARPATIVVRWGDWLGPTACFLALVLLLPAIRKRPGARS
jgi:apolipoprotein N-acyltransferase